MTSSQMPKEFDLPPRRLALRREQLEHAIATHPRVAARAHRTSRPTPRSHRLKRLPVLAGIAAVILLAGGVATGIVMSDYEQPPAALQGAMVALFPPARCTSPADGERLVRAELDRLGYADWKIKVNPTNANEPCVYPALDMAGTVFLVRAQTPEVSQALQRLEDRMWAECFDEQEAREVIGAELVELGVADWTIEVDRSITPGDQVRRTHMEAGCFVLVSSIHEEDGPVTYLINGDI